MRRCNSWCKVEVHECAERLVPLVDGAAESPLIRRGLDFFAMTLASASTVSSWVCCAATEEEIVAALWFWRLIVWSPRWMSNRMISPSYSSFAGASGPEAS